MHSVRFVQESYRRFVARLPADVRRGAEELPRHFGLTQAQADPLAAALRLAAPSLVGPTMPGAKGPQIERAMTAHFFAIVVGDSCRAVLDERIEATPAVLTILALARHERDEALAALVAG